jgi:hypothetical protein
MRLTAFLAVAIAPLAAGCLSASGSNTNPDNNQPGIDGSLPVLTSDGSVPVDSGGADAAAPEDAGQRDSAVPFFDASFDAATLKSLVTGLGSSVVSRSQHFSLVTKTGNEPGGAGVKSSAHFTLVSGAAAPSAP